jgi:methylmalonyl-CoA/ethylmalonyl-CoA epimerase
MDLHSCLPKLVKTVLFNIDYDITYECKLLSGILLTKSTYFVRIEYLGMMKQIDHIGIAVRSMEDALPLFSNLLGTEPFHEEIIASQHLKASFYALGDTKVELLEPINENSPIAKFLEKKGPGIHHVAFEVEDIRIAMKELTEKGFQAMTPEPYPGALGKLVCFFHPKTTGGVLVELCQKPVK